MEINLERMEEGGGKKKGKKRMHESPACFCFAFDRERHFKPEVIGRHSSWLAIHRRCQCQEGELNEMKRLLKKTVLGFCRQKGTRTSAVLGVEGLAGGNWGLKTQSGAKAKFPRAGRAPGSFCAAPCPGEEVQKWEEGG